MHAIEILSRQDFKKARQSAAVKKAGKGAKTLAYVVGIVVGGAFAIIGLNWYMTADHELVYFQFSSLREGGERGGHLTR